VWTRGACVWTLLVSERQRRRGPPRAVTACEWATVRYRGERQWRALYRPEGSSTRDETRHDSTRHDTTRLDSTRLDSTRLDSTRLDSTRHDTTQHDSTRHDTTCLDGRALY